MPWDKRIWSSFLYHFYLTCCNLYFFHFFKMMFFIPFLFDSLQVYAYSPFPHFSVTFWGMLDKKRTNVLWEEKEVFWEAKDSICLQNSGVKPGCQSKHVQASLSFLKVGQWVHIVFKAIKYIGNWLLVFLIVAIICMHHLSSFRSCIPLTLWLYAVKPCNKWVILFFLSIVAKDIDICLFLFPFNIKLLPKVCCTAIYHFYAA